MDQNSLSVVIPVYNEKDVIKDTIKQFKAIKENADFEMEIVFVNDGSIDGTEKVLNTVIHDGFVVIHHSKNRGYGAALKTGIKAANFSFIAITDADGTYPHERITEFFNITQKKNLDMLVGARIGANVHIPLIRKPAKKVLNLLANYLSGKKIPDLNSGFRIMRKEVVKRFFNILPSGFSFTTTITLAMLVNDEYEVEFVPIDYYHRQGNSKIRPIYDTLNFLQLIIRTTLYFDPLKIFVPFSFFIFLFAFIYLGGCLLLFGEIMDVSFGVILSTAFLILAIGMLADLIDKKIQ